MHNQIIQDFQKDSFFPKIKNKDNKIYKIIKFDQKQIRPYFYLGSVIKNNKRYYNTNLTAELPITMVINIININLGFKLGMHLNIGAYTTLEQKNQAKQHNDKKLTNTPIKTDDIDDLEYDKKYKFILDSTGFIQALMKAQNIEIGVGLAMPIQDITQESTFSTRLYTSITFPLYITKKSFINFNIGHIYGYGYLFSISLNRLNQDIQE